MLWRNVKVLNVEKKIEQKSVDTIRTLCLDTVEYVNHGHLGMPLGSATAGYVLFKDIMNYNPRNPLWFNRDRFVLTSGHGSILLYSLLHLSGYDLSIEDLKSFRQVDSKTPGHPEVHVTPGVEATTGPLGQGFSMTVGLALAEAHLASKFNTDKHKVIDHYTYTICGDGDLEEGVANEAASLAGHLGLGKLIVLYDSNDITSDGDLNLSYSEDTLKKFDAMNWHTIKVQDGNDWKEVKEAIEEGKRVTDKPTLIEVKTTIGYGSPNLQGTSNIHSDPIGEKETMLVKEFYEWDYEEKFFVPDDVKEHYSEIQDKGKKSEDDWNQLFDSYSKENPELSEQLLNALNNNYEFPQIEKFTQDKLATRSASGIVLNKIYEHYPVLLGGSADLASSNKTTITSEPFMSRGDFTGPNVHFGVREFAMASISNGLGLHGGIRPYCGTFLIFSDYMRSAIRHSAIMDVPVTYVMTHDSLLLGQDGPTHQPLEQLMSLRAMPNINVVRPADANETIAAWKIAFESKNTPTVIALGRHDVPVLNQARLDGVEKGAYIISEVENPVGIIIATGSEVELALDAQNILKEDNIDVNVISMPSWELFEKQSQEYKESVMPSDIVNRVSVELGVKFGWRQYVGEKGSIISVDTFQSSGPGVELLQKLDINPERIAREMKNIIEIN